MSRFFPLHSWESPAEKAHGRIEQRTIDVLPAEAAGIEDEWPGVRQICRVTRSRQRKKGGVWQEPVIEIAYLVTSLSGATAHPQQLLDFNRSHWSIENNLHRNKDVTLGEDACTNRKDHAPENISSLNNVTLSILKTVSTSPRRALEYFQDDKNRAIRAVIGFY
jgi:predicted transposase YbfD/YdcC